MKLSLPKLLGSIVLCEVVGLLGTPFTMAAIPTWYAYLEKPWFSPPNWVFGPVWTVLYLLMGISLYLLLVGNGKKPQRKAALQAFNAQLFFNFLWSVLFFGLHSPISGLIGIFMLASTIILTIKLFYPISRTAAYLLIPYLAWVCFATVLNVGIFFLN